MLRTVSIASAALTVCACAADPLVTPRAAKATEEEHSANRLLQSAALRDELHFYEGAFTVPATEMGPAQACVVAMRNVLPSPTQGPCTLEHAEAERTEAGWVDYLRPPAAFDRERYPANGRLWLATPEGAPNAARGHLDFNYFSYTVDPDRHHFFEDYAGDDLIEMLVDFGNISTNLPDHLVHALRARGPADAAQLLRCLVVAVSHRAQILKPRLGSRLTLAPEQSTAVQRSFWMQVADRLPMRFAALHPLPFLRSAQVHDGQRYWALGQGCGHPSGGGLQRPGSPLRGKFLGSGGDLFALADAVDPHKTLLLTRDSNDVSDVFAARSRHRQEYLDHGVSAALIEAPVQPEDPTADHPPRCALAERYAVDIYGVMETRLAALASTPRSASHVRARDTLLGLLTAVRRLREQDKVPVDFQVALAEDGRVFINDPSGIGDATGSEDDAYAEIVLCDYLKQLVPSPAWQAAGC